MDVHLKIHLVYHQLLLENATMSFKCLVRAWFEAVASMTMIWNAAGVRGQQTHKRVCEKLLPRSHCSCSVMPSAYIQGCFLADKRCLCKGVEHIKSTGASNLLPCKPQLSPESIGKKADAYAGRLIQLVNSNLLCQPPVQLEEWTFFSGLSWRWRWKMWGEDSASWPVLLGD